MASTVSRGGVAIFKFLSLSLSRGIQERLLLLADDDRHSKKEAIKLPNYCRRVVKSHSRMMRRIFHILSEGTKHARLVAIIIFIRYLVDKDDTRFYSLRQAKQSYFELS